jgi:photosystem II stability/assembly factor-like uncharacterized protein
VLPPTTSAIAADPLNRLHMVDAATGWAQTEQKILHTTDGGAHWQNVTPAGITSPIPAQMLTYTALDATTAWASAGKTIYRTTNAGQTWQATSLPIENSIAYVTFVDATYGWAVADVIAADGSESLTLYRTTDGGASWTQGATANGLGGSGGLPFAGEKSSPAFISPTTGWIGGSEPVTNFIYFYVTHDGGVTWRQQSLPRPMSQDFRSDVQTPTFFNASNGVLSVYASKLDGNNGAEFYYVTHDGGASWSMAGEVALDTLGTPDYLDMNHWWVLSGQIGNVLIYTGDGGQHWTTLTPESMFNGVQYIDFVSATVGWASARPDIELPVTLLHTTDGGHTWQQIHYQVG